jgi:hypothetical protein
LPDVSAFVASNKNLLDPDVCAVIVNITADEAFAPGVTTVIFAVPAATIFIAGIVAVSVVEFTKFVVTAEAFQLIAELLVKLDPVAVSVNAVPPAVIVLGDTELSIGTGGLCTTNARAAEMPAPEVETVILSVPAEAIFAAGTIAVNEVALI